MTTFYSDNCKEIEQRLAVLILNYNTAQKVEKQISALIKEGMMPSQFYVIDNNSDNNDSYRLKQFAGNHSLNFLQSDYNGGYAQGNNIAIAAAAADGREFFLILNPDIEISAQTIEQLFLKLWSDQTLLFIGPRICDKYDRNLIFSDGGLLDPDAYFESDHLHYSQSVDNHAPTGMNYNIDYVNGSALMFKNESLTILGKMREDFFMYFEEAEWCYRIKKHSTYRQAVLTDVTAYHEMSDKGNFYQFYMTRNRIFMCRLYHIPHRDLLKHYLYEAQKRFLGFKGNMKKNFWFFVSQVRAVTEGEFKPLKS